MRIGCAVFSLLMCSITHAAATSEEGNKPLSAANYTDWPNLVDAVNDDSRILQVWVNGNEGFYYSGNTQTANRVLKEFAETQYPGLQLVLFPGPAPVTEVFGKKVNANYRIEIVGGIARAAIQRSNLKRIYTLHPTMTIYLSENIELSKLQVPGNVKLLQLDDLEERYRKALDDEDAQVKMTAQRLLDGLNKEFQRQGAEYKKLEHQLAEIERLIQTRKAKAERDNS